MSPENRRKAGERLKTLYKDPVFRFKRAMGIRKRYAKRKAMKKKGWSDKWMRNRKKAVDTRIRNYGVPAGYEDMYREIQATVRKKTGYLHPKEVAVQIILDYIKKKNPGV